MKRGLIRVLILPAVLAISLEAAESTLLSIGYGRFAPADARYEMIYASGREIYSLEIVQPILRRDRHLLGLSAGLRRFVKKGRSTLTQDPTRLTLVPLSLGLRYLLNLGPVRPWAEVGLDRVGYEEDSSLQVSSGSAYGYHVQGGVSLRPPGIDRLGLQILVRHSRAVAEENGISVNLGGWEYGLGLVFAFQIF